MDGSEMGFRDDVLNVLYLISWFITKVDWSEYCEKTMKPELGIWCYVTNPGL